MLLPIGCPEARWLAASCGTSTSALPDRLLPPLSPPLRSRRHYGNAPGGKAALPGSKGGATQSEGGAARRRADSVPCACVMPQLGVTLYRDLSSYAL